jgi:UrcA family protein
MKLMATKTSFTRVAALLLGATLGTSVPAVCVAGNEPVTATVQIADLNLATTHGKKTLARRTASAVDKVCPVRGSIAGPRGGYATARRECAQTVHSSVEKQLVERRGHSVVGT